MPCKDEATKSTYKLIWHKKSNPAYRFISPLWTDACSLTAPDAVSRYTRRACKYLSSSICLKYCFSTLPLSSSWGNLTLQKVLPLDRAHNLECCLRGGQSLGNGGPKTCSKRVPSLFKYVRIHRRGRIVEGRTFNGVEFEIGPQHKFSPPIPPTANLEAGAHTDNLQQIERQAKVIARSCWTGNLAYDSCSVVIFSHVKGHTEFRIASESPTAG